MSQNKIDELRKAQIIVNHAIHPDTGKVIPWIMRWTSYVPANLPISFGMVIAAPTPLNTIFWHGMNQTYNASLNYANKREDQNYSNKDIVKGYTCACTSSISVALLIRKLLESRTRHMSGPRLIFYNSISSFFACASAGFLNAYCMR